MSSNSRAKKYITKIVDDINLARFVMYMYKNQKGCTTKRNLFNFFN